MSSPFNVNTDRAIIGSSFRSTDLSIWRSLDLLYFRHFVILKCLLFIISFSHFLVILQATAKCNFDETVEAHVQLGIDAKRNVMCHPF